jgi:L,D-peptidoglycan transpeptidase YkuD (ErfK/YbiS/YcfS/YnhG family)
MGRLLLFLPLLLSVSHLWASPIPEKSRALLVAVPDHWNSRQTSLQLYRRASAQDPWIKTNATIPVHLGRRGLAWGRGLHPAQPGIQKREGDGKSPAGLFLLGNILYGYADRSPIPGWRYRLATYVP